MRQCLEKGTELVQAMANSLFSLSSTEDRDGPIVKLPPPSTKLPREKHVIFPLLLFVFFPLVLLLIGIFFFYVAAT